MNVGVQTRWRVRACGDGKKMRERSGNESAASQSEHDLRSHSDLGSWPLVVGLWECASESRPLSAWKRPPTSRQRWREWRRKWRRQRAVTRFDRRDLVAIVPPCWWAVLAYMPDGIWRSSATGRSFGLLLVSLRGPRRSNCLPMIVTSIENFWYIIMHEILIIY